MNLRHVYTSATPGQSYCFRFYGFALFSIYDHYWCVGVGFPRDWSLQFSCGKDFRWFSVDLSQAEGEG